MEHHFYWYNGTDYKHVIQSLLLHRQPSVNFIKWKNINKWNLCLQVKPLFQTSSQEVLTDIAALMVTNDTVAMDIAIALGESSSNILLGKRVSHK